MKEVNIVTEYITLGQLIKFIGLVDSGVEAKSFLCSHKIKVNHEEENRRGRKLYPNYLIEIDNLEILIKDGNKKD